MNHRIGATSGFEDEIEEDEAATFRSQTSFSFNLASTSEERFPPRPVPRFEPETLKMECDDLGCDFYSQLQELKRANVEKLQQVVFLSNRVTGPESSNYAY